MASKVAAGGSTGPICPNCRQALRDTLRHEELAAAGTSEGDAPAPILVTYCGSCGWTLSAVPGAFWFGVGSNLESQEVLDPDDASTLEGQFQIRCRCVIAEISALGFTPVGWIEMINRLGAAGTAAELLAKRRILPVTHWLVSRGHPELTLEHEIEQPRWADLFTDADREEARRRLAIAGE